MVIFYSLVSSLTKFSIEKQPVNFKCKEEKNNGFGFFFYSFIAKILINHYLSGNKYSMHNFCAH